MPLSCSPSSDNEAQPVSAETVVKADEKEADKETSNEAMKQLEKDEKKEIIKSLWISGLSSVTRAVDLKTTFSKYGKVSVLRYL